MVFPSDNITVDSKTIYFKCHGYSIYIATPGEAFFRNLTDNLYYVADWIETANEIKFTLVPTSIGLGKVSNYKFQIALSKTPTGLKFKQYQKLE